jgi:hypothetical protein
VGIPVVGTVEFDLRQIGNGEYFEIRDGAMEGYALVVFPFKGDLVGSLKCTGDQPTLELGLKNGVYAVGPAYFYFDGKAVAIYNKKDAYFEAGEWAVTEPSNYAQILQDDGAIDLSQAVYSPLPPLTPGTDPLLDMFVVGGTGAWDALWVGPETGVGTTTTADGGGP